MERKHKQRTRATADLPFASKLLVDSSPFWNTNKLDIQKWYAKGHVDGQEHAKNEFIAMVDTNMKMAKENTESVINHMAQRGFLPEDVYIKSNNGMDFSIMLIVPKSALTDEGFIPVVSEIEDIAQKSNSQDYGFNSSIIFNTGNINQESITLDGYFRIFSPEKEKATTR